MQSAVCLGEHVAIRACHDGFPAIMVFDLNRDPHETRDLAPDHPELAAAAMAKLEAWYAPRMTNSADDIDSDGVARKRHLTHLPPSSYSFGVPVFRLRARTSVVQIDERAAAHYWRGGAYLAFGGPGYILTEVACD